MKKGIIYPTSRIEAPADMEGESLEEFLRKAKASKQPIDASAAIGYTDRKDGVLPQYDIRTDKFALAQEKAMELHAAAYADMMTGDGFIKNEQGNWVPDPSNQKPVAEA